MLHLHKLSKYTLLSLILLTSFSSCVTYENLLYFRTVDQARPQNLNEQIQNLKPLTIQTNDILTITVHSFDPVLAAPFNMINSQVGSTAVGTGNASPLATYLVDENGQIDFPVLGKIEVRGKTITESKVDIVKKLQTYLKEPVLNMRLANFRISVLGEVKNPGSFVVNNDRITVLEAMGMAGDLTPYSNRQNILVIREINGMRTFGELNMQSADIFRSDFYYLKQGDVVYVEPTKEKEGDIRDKSAEYTPWISVALQAIIGTITAIALLK